MIVKIVKKVYNSVFVENFLYLCLVADATDIFIGKRLA